MIKLFTSVLLSIVIFCGCFTSEKRTNVVKTNEETDAIEVREYDIIDEENDKKCTEHKQATSIVEDTEVKKLPYPDKETVLEMQKYWSGLFVIPDNNVYYNMNAGYSIEFPQDFNGWYKIYEYVDSDCEYITVFFVGKSETCQSLWAKEGYPGLELFSISNEKDEQLYQYVRDEIELLGIANGHKYYYHTPTSYSAALAFDRIEEVDGDEYKLLTEDERMYKSFMYRTAEIKVGFKELLLER